MTVAIDVTWRSGTDKLRHAYTSTKASAKALCGAGLRHERFDNPEQPNCPDCVHELGGDMDAAWERTQENPTPAIPKPRSGAPKAARTVSRGRIYTINGRSLWSVTTIIGTGLPKPAIAGWQARTIAEYAVANHRQLEAMLAGVRLRRDSADAPYYVVTDPDAVQAAVDWLKGSPWRESERKMKLGSAVHAEAEAVMLGTPRPEPPLTVAPFVSSFRHFLEDFAPVDIELVEATVFNMREGYAGTLDIIVRIGGRRILVDTKTGKDIYPDVALQLAAYKNAEAILLDDGRTFPMPDVDGAAALHLREYDPAVPGDRGYSLIPVDAGDAAWNAFRYVREVMRWLEETSKGVLSQPVTTPQALAFLYPTTVAVTDVEVREAPATTEGSAA